MYYQCREMLLLFFSQFLLQFSLTNALSTGSGRERMQLKQPRNGPSGKGISTATVGQRWRQVSLKRQRCFRARNCHPRSGSLSLGTEERERNHLWAPCDQQERDLDVQCDLGWSSLIAPPTGRIGEMLGCGFWFVFCLGDSLHGSFWETDKQGLLTHTCNPSTWEAEAGGLPRAWGQFRLYYNTLSQSPSPN